MQESLPRKRTWTQFPASAVTSATGAMVRRRRREAGLSQRELGSLAGLTRETVYRLESGRRPSPRAVAAIHDALGLDSEQLVEGWPVTADPDLPCFGARVRRLRRDLSLTLEQVADAAGVSASSLSRFENEQAAPAALVRVGADRTGGPTLTVIGEGLAAVLGFACASELHAFCEGLIDED